MKKDYSTLKYFTHHVFLRDYLIRSQGTLKGHPLPTFFDKYWLKGYSNHFPVVLYLVKEKK